VWLSEANQKICPACWAKNRANADVCRACGAPLPAGAVGKQTDERPPAPGETQPVPPPAATPGAARVVYPPETDQAQMETEMLADRYRLVYEIARGGMGIVYLAEDTYLDNLRVAIKLLIASISPDLNAEKRLKREALTAMRLSHQNIMRLYSFDHFAGQSYLVMEYINGPTLEGLTMERGKLTPAEVTLFMRPTCEALYYAHEQGVVHRDIKPANIMLALPADSPFVSGTGPGKRISTAGSSKPTATLGGSGAHTGSTQAVPPAPDVPGAKRPLSEFDIEQARTATVKICDFGIAQQLRQTMTRLTGTSLIGSPVYMSPEQLEGTQLDHRTDIYSLGVSVYEMLTGELPFEGSMHSLTYQIMEKGPPPVRGVEESLSEVVLKCMAKDPRDRWQNCLEFADALEAALEGKAAPVSAPESVYGPRTKSMKRGTHLSSEVSPRKTLGWKAKMTERRVADLRVAEMSFEEKLYDKALEEMRQYRRLHGDSEELLTFAAQCVDTLVNRRAFAQAHDFCQFVLLIDSENPNVYLTLGRIQRVLGRATDAERNLRMAMMYGAEEDVVEKELRGTLSELRDLGSGLGPGRVLRMTPARIGAYAAAVLLAVGISFVMALLASLHGRNHVLSYVVIGVITAVPAGAASLLLTTVFCGPLDQLRHRGGLVKTYLARHGYAGGLLGITALGILAWLLASALFRERMSNPPAVFSLIFGLVVWVGSVLYSWFVVYGALREKRFGDMD